MSVRRSAREGTRESAKLLDGAAVNPAPVDDDDEVDDYSSSEDDNFFA